MDTESIKPLVSILIWGGLFFSMMHFGCGAHLMGGHGHGHHGGHGDAGGETKDPVYCMYIYLVYAPLYNLFSHRSATAGKQQWTERRKHGH